MEHLRFDELKNGEEMTVDMLAVMIGKGFEYVDAKLDGVEQRLGGRLDSLDARMGRLEADVKELHGEIVYRHEFEDALAHIKYLENKLGIESGV